MLENISFPKYLFMFYRSILKNRFQRLIFKFLTFLFYVYSIYSWTTGIFEIEIRFFDNE